MSEISVRSIVGKEGSPVYFPSGIVVGSTTGGGGINNIGVMGGPGFGVGIAPRVPTGFTPAGGYTDVLSDGYGCYVYSDGSVMRWVPAFFYKWGTGSNGFAVNDVDIKPFGAYETVAKANADGYALHRAFYDGGAVKEGVFVDQFLCSNNLGTASSLKNGKPLSSSESHNPVAGLTGSPSNINASFIAAAKTRGADFFCSSIFIFKALALISYAHGRASNNNTYCKWYSDTTTNFPKGCNNNALGDANDGDLSFVSDGFDNAAKTGSANLLARTTHNGQNSGIADLNGCMWEVCPGLTMDGSTTADNFYVLKTGVAMKDVTAGTTLATDLWGATGYAALYDNLGVMSDFTGTALNFTDRTLSMGSASQVLSHATSGTAWKMAGAGVPVAVGGTNAFGNDGIYDYSTDQMLPIAGGGWSRGSAAGVWAVNLHFSRTHSNTDYGFRAALYL